MTDKTIPESAVRIAHRSSHAPSRTRWTEISIFYDQAAQDREPGDRKPWIAVVAGLSTEPGDTARRNVHRAGTLERALKIIDRTTQIGMVVCAEAEEWLADHPEANQGVPIGELADDIVNGLVPRFSDQIDALRWLYGDEAFEQLTPAKLLERDMGAGEGTVRAALKAGRDIRVPLLALIPFINRDAFRRAKGLADA